MRKGETIGAVINGYDLNGRGTARVYGKIVKVSGAIAGEKVEARLIGYGEGGEFLAETVKTLQPSKDRVAPPCPYAAKCGGCTYQHIAYGKQLDIKRELVASTLTDKGITANVNPAVGLYHPFSYRNKLTLAVGQKNGRVILGFFREGTKEIIDVPECILHDKWAVTVYKLAKAYMIRSKIVPYDIDTGEGNLRYIVARCIDNNLLITMVAAGKFLNGIEYFYRALKEVFPSVTMYFNMNRNTDSAVFSERFVRLYGDERMHCKINGIDLELHPTSFLQVNTEMMLKIYKKVFELAGADAGKTVIDLFSGIGITSLFFAKAGATVISIESEKSSCIEARRLAAQNNLSQNINVLEGDCETKLPEVLSNLKASDITVFADPPRKGLGAKVSKLLASSGASQILYLSCNPASLAEDLTHFKDNYTVTAILPYDMFPQTKHLETLVCLTRK